MHHMTTTKIDLDQPPLSPAARERLDAELAVLRATRDQFAAAINDQAEPTGDAADRADVVTRFEELDRVDRQIEDILLALTRPTRTEAPADGVVGIGSQVTLRYADGDRETVMLGDLLEGDGDDNLVTPRSPLGQALLGQPVGAKITYRAPTGEVRVEVEAISAA
jgi:transcription elongation factor GreA